MTILYINGIKIQISAPLSIFKRIKPENSYVIISILGKELFLAPKIYAKSDKMNYFYEQNQIGSNINLLDIEHGTQEDCPTKTLPLFQSAASKIQRHLLETNKVLVSCNHGRSRSGTVIALYLMTYHNLSADQAITMVSTALEIRGYSGGIDIKGGYYGTYGEWLRGLFRADSDKENDATRLLHLDPSATIMPIQPYLHVPTPDENTALSFGIEHSDGKLCGKKRSISTTRNTERDCAFFSPAKKQQHEEISSASLVPTLKFKQ